MAADWSSYSTAPWNDSTRTHQFIVNGTCKEYIQQDAMQGPKHYYHVHFVSQPEDLHACPQKIQVVMSDEYEILQSWKLQITNPFKHFTEIKCLMYHLF